MKIEKISDSQIRCTLTNFDLSIRNLNLGELSYGSEKAKDLFSEMMQKASAEVGFDVEGFPLMIEAIPLKDEGIVLMITKVEDPEEMDARFARFAPFTEENEAPRQPSFIDTIISNIQKTVEALSEDSKRAFIFDSLDDVTEAAKALGELYKEKNSLYKNPENRKYCLILEEEGTDHAAFISTCNILGEYGKATIFNYTGSGYLDEHYEIIIKDKALEKMSRL